MDLEISGMAYGGEAFGRDESGRMIFVPFALPGEKVHLELVEEHTRWARGRAIALLSASAERQPARCQHFTVCGGCHYQHIPYQQQVRHKEEILADQMRRLGGFDHLPLQESLSSPQPWNYRNHLRFSLTPEGEIGFVTSTQDRVFALQECHLPEAALDDLWRRLQLEPIEGLRFVSVRAGTQGQQQVTLHADREPDLELELDFPASVIWLQDDQFHVLAGEERISIQVLDRHFQVSAGSFFQVNTSLAGALVERALGDLELRAGETVFDLFAGVGLFSAFMAGAGARIVAVEQSPWAAVDFEANLDEFDGIDLYQASVEEALPAIQERPAAVLLDPPRAGLSRSAMESLINALPPRLVYVSCDPSTLARDGRRLAREGYHLDRITLVDLFPQTFHIETVSRWSLAP